MKGLQIKHLHIKTDYKEWMEERKSAKPKREEPSSSSENVEEHKTSNHKKEIQPKEFTRKSHDFPIKELRTKEDIEERIQFFEDLINLFMLYERDVKYYNGSRKLSPPYDDKIKEAKGEIRPRVL